MNKEIMKLAGFEKEVEMVEDGLCPFCGNVIDITEFHDALSYKEFKISGLCFNCQREIFKI
jgi:prepilin signal peptidase PulO-like enzyme (type II secretory pathway)